MASIETTIINRGFEIKSPDVKNLSFNQYEIDEVLKNSSHTLTVLEIFVKTNRNLDYIFQ